MRVRSAVVLASVALAVSACSSVTPPPDPTGSSAVGSTPPATTSGPSTTPSSSSTAPSSTGSPSSSVVDSTAAPTPTAPPLDPATEAWFTADCAGQAELRRLAQVSLGTTPEQQRAGVELIYRQYADFALATRDQLDALDPPDFPGGLAVKQARVLVFAALHEQYTAGLAAITAADPKTTEDLNLVIDQVEAAVNNAVAAVPQPAVTTPPDIAAQILELPACLPGTLPSATASASSSGTATTGPSTTVFSAPATAPATA